VKFSCTNCGQHIEADDSDAERQASCPTCCHDLVIPDANRPLSVPARKTKQKSILAGLLLLGLFAFAFYHFCGIFVIQPLEAIPSGATVVYWRADLRLPFISSGDGFLQASGEGVSPLGRAVFLANLFGKIADRKIVSLPYSKTLFLWSTGGSKYDR
jgi:hypothetical protein